MGRMDRKMMGKRDMGKIKMGRREMGSRGMKRIEREKMGMGSMRMEIRRLKLLLLELWYHSTSEQVKEREGTIQVHNKVDTEPAQGPQTPKLSFYHVFQLD